MNEIIFPGLNLKLQISKIAFSIGSIQIYWYALIMVFAFVLGIILLKIKNQKFGISYNLVLDLIVILIPITIIFARLYYVIFKLDYYVQKPMQIFNLRGGGLAIYGGIISRCNYLLHIL